MISKSCLLHLRLLASGSSRNALRNDSPQCLRRHASRSMATITDIPVHNVTPLAKPSLTTSVNDAPLDHNSHVTTTVYKFPTMEPLRFAYYPHSHLYLPLRKDILHRAVIYEGDMTRQGTASTKWRSEVHGSNRKVHPQKGTGKARAGDKKSPIRRGGGVAFGPKPRDFSTQLPNKIYDLAWRTALSYRYRRGELIVVDVIRKDGPAESWFLNQIFEANGWSGKGTRNSLFVPHEKRKNNRPLFETLDRLKSIGRMLELADVDVKNLLEMGRIVIEQKALDALLKAHSSDLVPSLGPVAASIGATNQAIEQD